MYIEIYMGSLIDILSCHVKLDYKGMLFFYYQWGKNHG